MLIVPYVISSFFRILSLNLKTEISQKVMIDCEHSSCDNFGLKKLAWAGDKLFVFSSTTDQLFIWKGK